MYVIPVLRDISKLKNNTNEDKEIQLISLSSGDLFEVPVLAKHQIINDSNDNCIIIEIQYGERVDELDIERFFYYPETP